MLTRSKQLLIFGLVLIVISASSVYSFFFFKNQQQPSESAQVTELETTEEQGDFIPESDEQKTDPALSMSVLETFEARFSERKTLSVLLLGYGGAGHSGGMLSDAIQVARIDFEAKNITLIALPRDLWLTLPNDKQGKINQVLTLGAGKNKILSGGAVAKQVAGEIVGFPIDYFIAVDFTGFKRIIGQELKGLTVVVPEALNDQWYPILGEEQNTCGKSPEEVAQLSSQYSGFELERQFECRYLDLQIPAGTTKLQGEEALAYARSRHGSAGGDFSRGQRQQILLEALTDHFFTVQGAQQAVKLFTQFSRHTVTDANTQLVEYLIPIAQTITELTVKKVGINTSNALEYQKSQSGQSILVPKSGLDNWRSVQEFTLQ